MTKPNVLNETRFNRLVLGGWWLAVAILGALRLMRGDMEMATVLFVSSTLTALLGVALSVYRERHAGVEAADGQSAETYRLQKATLLFSLIAVTTVVACAIMSGAMWWAAMECSALLWVLPAVVSPLAQAYMRKQHQSRAAAA